MIPFEIDTFLHERTGGIRHSGRTLYEHLKGTHHILEQARALDYVRLAGLFHSIYGTNLFRTQAITLDGRAEVSEVIGDRAERLAYIFCACNRPKVLLEEASRSAPYKVTDRYNGETIVLTTADLYDLLTIELANLAEQNNLDLLPQISDALKRLTDEMLSDMRSSVPTDA